MKKVKDERGFEPLAKAAKVADAGAAFEALYAADQAARNIRPDAKTAAELFELWRDRFGSKGTLGRWLTAKCVAGRMRVVTKYMTDSRGRRQRVAAYLAVEQKAKKGAKNAT